VIDNKRSPILILLASHWISMIGVILVTLSGFSWIFALPAHIRGEAKNPYIGLLLFVVLPGVFITGLILIPIGNALAKRRVQEHLSEIPDRRAAWKRVAIFFAVTTFANILIASQGTYRAVEHMESVQFCGQSCHVMKPEFTGHMMAPHQAVACVDCHVVPGAVGLVKSKMAGTQQLIGVVFNTFPRPIESAMENNKLVSSAETCEHCHSRQKDSGKSLRVLTKFKEDEGNTRTDTVLMMMTGGGMSGGIHGAHLGKGVSIHYAAADKKRQTIPWVEYTNSDTGVTRTYLAGDAKPESIAALPKFEMQCVDCHNRAAHAFEQADHAIDGALASGSISSALPFVKKTGLGLIKADYPSSEEAAIKISLGLTAFYREKYPQVATAQAPAIKAAADQLAAIYPRNVFPDLKVTWGTYVNNLGHMDSLGCFRCHDESHSTSAKKTITQDCTTCHQALAMEETNPEILKSLGLAGDGQKK
jgi:hypothetical protein